MGLLGLRSIPSILGGKTQHLVDTATAEAQAQLGIFPTVVTRIQHSHTEWETAGTLLALPRVVKAAYGPHPRRSHSTQNKGVVDSRHAFEGFRKSGTEEAGNGDDAGREREGNGEKTAQRPRAASAGTFSVPCKKQKCTGRSLTRYPTH